MNKVFTYRVLLKVAHMCLFNVQSSQIEHELKLKLIKIAARNQKDEAKIAKKGKPPRSVERRMRHIMAMEGH